MITVTAFLLRACSQARYALGARRNVHSSGLRYWELAERQGIGTSMRSRATPSRDRRQIPGAILQN